MFKYYCTYLVKQNHNQIENILVDKILLSTVLYVPSVREVKCDSDHHMVVTNVREILAVIK
jgi:hypothetical protein